MATSLYKHSCFPFASHVRRVQGSVPCHPRDQVPLLPVWPSVCGHEVRLPRRTPLPRAHPRVAGNSCLPATTLSNSTTQISQSSSERPRAPQHALLHVSVRLHLLAFSAWLISPCFSAVSNLERGVERHVELDGLGAKDVETKVTQLLTTS
jgi:hypothetical protein